MTERRIKFTSTYADGEYECEETVLIASYDEDWLHDELFQYTGTGPHRSNDSAFYTAESVDGLEPAIFVEWG